MRLADFSDYWTLRRIAENPWEVVRFRKRSKRPGSPRELEVRLLDGGSFFLRAGQTDFHVFNRIVVRDEYDLDALGAAAWDTIVDVGANVGAFACRVARMARRVVMGVARLALAEVEAGEGGEVADDEAAAGEGHRAP